MGDKPQRRQGLATVRQGGAAMNTQEKLTAIRDKCVLDVEHYVKLGPLIYSRQESALAACRSTIAAIDSIKKISDMTWQKNEAYGESQRALNAILTAWEGIV